MSAPTRSYLKVPYDLRMSKQIERRMIIDLLTRLRTAGFDLSNYQYTGMGSIYFVDHILFHRFAGLKRLVSVEYSSEITKRVQFNRPFRCVQVELGAIGDYIPRLSRDLQHLLWLDYDDHANRNILDDVANASTVLTPGSILLVTVEVEPPKEGGKNPRQWRQFFEKRLGSYFDQTWKPGFFSQSRLASANVEFLRRAIQRGLAGREHADFLPLLNFVYADGREMLTMGGMIGSDAERRRLRACEFSDAVYVRQNLSQAPYRIPKIFMTRKERLYMDAQMPPRRKNWRPADFELDPRQVTDYAEVYRFLPSYAELLL